MIFLDYLNASIEGGDVSTAAACVLAHPASLTLAPETVSRLFEIGFGGAQTSPCDEAFVSLMAEAVNTMEALA